MKSKWTEALNKLPEEPVIEPREDGWMTFDEFRRDLNEDGQNIADNKARNILKQMIANGLAECRMMEGVSVTGRKTQTPYYRPI